MEAIRRGNAFIGMTPDAPTIALTAGAAIMGQTSVADSLEIEIGKLSGTDEIRLIDESGVFYSVTPKACQKYVFTQSAEKKSFIRVEIWRNIEGLGTTLASISNPIYFK